MRVNKKKAEEDPLWNRALTVAYLDKVSCKDDLRFSTTEEKQAYLIEHGTMIARLNGWEEHKKLSAKNSSGGRIRKIFYSKEFRHKNTYLCIDLEHPDLRFELCNHKGKHLGEYKHTGEQTGGASSDHNIEV